MQPTVSDSHILSGLGQVDALSEDELTELLRSILDRLGLSTNLGDLQKPYPSEHAARQNPPDKYTAVRRKNGAFGSGIDVIYGVLANGKTEVQSIRFDAAKFSPAEARTWLADHDYKVTLEESTSKEYSMEVAKQDIETLRVSLGKADIYCNQCGAPTDKLMLSSDHLLLVCPKCANRAGLSQDEEPEEPKEEAEAESESEEAESEKADAPASSASENIDLAKTTFTDAPWSTPESDLEPNAFCAVCLIDENPSGVEKTKSKCHLPVRSKPGGPVNKAALRNAAARLNQVQASAEAKASAKRKLVSLMHAAGIETSMDKEDVLDKSSNVTDIDLTGAIIKSDDEKRLVYGVSYPARHADWVDTQGDHMTDTEIEAMAHRWMIKSQQYDLQHQIIGLPRDQAVVVESYIAPVDFTINNHTITKGSWIVVTHIPDAAVWQQIKARQINAYSIRGKGRRRVVTN